MKGRRTEEADSAQEALQENLQELESRRRDLKILNEFAVSLMAIDTVDRLFWYVAKEVVGRLGFIDCVVYRFDPEREMLVQAAAIGEKNPEEEVITNKLEIPLGSGITGLVAKTREPVIIDDLADDPRYLPDLVEARSEICVPLVIDDELFGVIDSEDPEPHQFNANHLEILTTVASLTSSKILQCRAMEALSDQAEVLRARNTQQAKMGRALNTALIEANKANRSQSAFLANASHELRTPLNAIVGFSEIITNPKMRPDDPDKMIEYVGIIKGAGEHLTNIVNDLLDISSLAAGEVAPNLQILDCNKELELTLLLLTHKAADKGVEITTNLTKNSTAIRFDQRHLKQIVINLVDNAIKYSASGSSIHITTRHDTHGHILLSVKDQGQGIAEENMELIFTPFSREDPQKSKAIEGVGLGLALVRELARVNKSEIEVSSEIGKGSTFTLRIPASIKDEDGEKQRHHSVVS